MYHGVVKVGIVILIIVDKDYQFLLEIVTLFVVKDVIILYN